MELNSTSQLLHELYEQQQASMRRMLEAWDRELDAQAEAFREAAKKQVAADAVAAQNAAALEVYLEGLVAQAKGGSDVSVTIPSGVRVAGQLAIAPNFAELAALVDQVDDSEAAYAHSQQSAACALGAGLMPHPGDLADLMRAGKVDEPFAARLAGLATQLDRIEGAPTKHPQLALIAAGDRLGTLQDQVRVMKAYGADRTLSLVRDPKSLGADLSRAVPQTAAGRGPKMGHAALGRVLDSLFSK